jgi:spore coat polysaccharide biosynthesis protein SpsF
VKTVVIIQARMGSTRLPGKVLLDLGGQTVLSRVVRRTQQSKRTQEILVATTDLAQDAAIVAECDRLHVSCFRGSEQDVLQRYYGAAMSCAADAVVRITSDCPLIDPDVMDETIRVFEDERADYASNVNPRRFPRGLDAEVFTVAVLERAWREAREPYQREHVTPYIYNHPETFHIASNIGKDDYSEHRWTLDTPEDLNLMRAIYASFGNAQTFGWRDVLALVESRQDIRELNSQVVQKSLRD